jgi:hypothetical protein
MCKFRSHALFFLKWTSVSHDRATRPGRVREENKYNIEEIEKQTYKIHNVR